MSLMHFWCPGEDSNLHRIAPTRPSSVRVYHFATWANMPEESSNHHDMNKEKTLNPAEPGSRHYVDTDR